MHVINGDLTTQHLRCLHLRGPTGFVTKFKEVPSDSFFYQIYLQNLEAQTVPLKVQHVKILSCQIFLRSQSPSTPNSRICQTEHVPLPSISPVQTSTISSRRVERKLCARVRLMELNPTLEVKGSGCKLPNRSVQLLHLKSHRPHGVQKVQPRNLTRLCSARRLEEKRFERLQRSSVDFELRLRIGFLRLRRKLRHNWRRWR